MTFHLESERFFHNVNTMYEKNTYRLYPIMNSNVRSMHGERIRSEFGLSFTISGLYIDKIIVSEFGLSFYYIVLSFLVNKSFTRESTGNCRYDPYYFFSHI